jgi:hypothetical protein
MSFDVYLQWVGGESPGILRAAVRALFPIVEENSDPDYWSIHYDRNDWCKIDVTPAKSDREFITSLAVNRPCGDVRFWESILAILEMGPVILYWPGGGPLVGSESVATKFPPEIAKSFGRPKCVGSAREIMDAIRES